LDSGDTADVSLWDVGDYLRLRTGGDDLGLDLFAERFVTPGTRVLDLGCGPGRGSAALAERYGARVTGLDASPEMLAAARQIVPADVELVEARAEDLPFPAEAFDAAIAQFVVHLLDRPRAFAELRRVQHAGGVLWLKTSDPDRLDGHWLIQPFPVLLERERARFPDELSLRVDLEAAGFDVEFERREIGRRFTKAEALERIRARAYSTMALLNEDELAEGIERAERILADPVEYDLTLLFAVARPA
jgi:ubiquinone/menaquinone biosynthesis C-methylase UbiE